jgi:hypothetical protein
VERARKQTGCLSTDKGKFLLPSPDFFIASFSALPASVSLDPVPSSAKSAYPGKKTADGQNSHFVLIKFVISSCALGRPNSRKKK